MLNNLDDDGHFRIECPASAGVPRCPHKPASMRRSPSRLPTVIPNPTASPNSNGGGSVSVPVAIGPAPTLPKVCAQRTLTVSLADLPLTQKHYWGSADWYRSFNRRNRVEGWFGNIKNEATEHMLRGNTRVMGIAKVSMLIAAQAVAANLRLIDSFDVRHAPAPPTVPGTKPGRRRARRRTVAEAFAARHSRAP